MKSTTLSNLIARAVTNRGESVASTWRAYDNGEFVTVTHYSTDMVEVYRDGSIVPLSAGWGSMSDKKGIRTITGRGYWEIFTK